MLVDINFQKHNFFLKIMIRNITEFFNLFALFSVFEIPQDYDFGDILFSQLH